MWLEKQKKLWDESVQQRYRNSRIHTVALGVKHMQMVKYINSRPVKINVVEVNRQLNSNIKMMPEMASSFSLSGRRTIRTIAQRNNSIAAVNCTYFKPQNGNGYGTMYSNTSLYIEDREWGNGQYAFDANGAMVKNAWYGGYYYNNDGRRAN